MNAILGSRIRNLREMKGFTQEQISDKMNCSRQKYARMEKGIVDISYANINMIAQILNINVEEITSSVNDSTYEKHMYRANSNGGQEDVFEFINTMLDTFYAHKKLYNSVRQVDMDE
ncbi:MAG: helix-turn-helix transcriptional regulator [Clostridiales bacterium]|nr:helix-turn-helix transcriptional regulator [Clostridiales bacterium]